MSESELATFAKNRQGNVFILLPQIDKNSYCFKGYNWFSLETLEYNSCCLFKTKEEAVQEYSQSMTIFKGELTAAL